MIATAVVVALPVLISLAKALLRLIRKTLFAKVLEKDVRSKLEKLQTEVQSAEERLQNLATTTTSNRKLFSTTAMAMEDLDVLLDEMKKRVDHKYTEKLQRRKRDQFGLKNGVEESRNKKDKHELEHFRRELARCLRHLELAVGKEEGLKTLRFCADRLKSIVDKYIICGSARSEYKPHGMAMRLNLAE